MTVEAIGLVVCHAAGLLDDAVVGVGAGPDVLADGADDKMLAGFGSEAAAVERGRDP